MFSLWTLTLYSRFRFSLYILTLYYHFRKLQHTLQIQQEEVHLHPHAPHHRHSRTLHHCQLPQQHHRPHSHCEASYPYSVWKNYTTDTFLHQNSLFSVLLYVLGYMVLFEILNVWWFLRHCLLMKFYLHTLLCYLHYVG
jgi:hypothetical protein